MPNINCPNCHKQVSDRADNCPLCGCQLINNPALSEPADDTLDDPYLRRAINEIFEKGHDSYSDEEFVDGFAQGFELLREGRNNEAYECFERIRKRFDDIFSSFILEP